MLLRGCNELLADRQCFATIVCICDCCSPPCSVAYKESLELIVPVNLYV